MEKETNQFYNPVPLIVARANFMNKLTEIVNQSCLPAFVMRDVIKDLLHVLEDMSTNEFQAAIANQGSKNNPDDKNGGQT